MLDNTYPKLEDMIIIATIYDCGNVPIKETVCITFNLLWLRVIEHSSAKGLGETQHSSTVP